MPKKVKNLKMNFLIFFETISITHGIKTIFFPHIWASIKAAPDIGGIVVTTMITWNYFSKTNEKKGQFWALSIKRRERMEDVGAKKPRIPPWEQNIKSVSQLLLSPKSYSILKFWLKWMENTSLFLSIFF